jgi:hypothetical protein
VAAYRRTERAAERVCERHLFRLGGATVGLQENSVERFVEREWHLTLRW